MKHVCVVGGGIIGLMSAWRLQQAGVRVTLCERRALAQEASFAAAGIVGPQAEADKDSPWLRLALHSRELYPEVAAALAVPYQKSSLAYVALDEIQAAGLKKRALWQQQLGLHAEWTDAARTLVAEASEATFGALHLRDEGWIDPRALTAALGRVLGSVRTQAPVERIVSAHGAVQGVALAGGEIIAADHVLVAAGAWASRIPGGDPALEKNAIEPVRGVLQLLDWPRHRLQRIAYWRGGYVVPRGGSAVVLGSSSEPAGFEKVIAQEAIDGIRARAFRALPTLESATVVDQWCGLRPFARRETPILCNAPSLTGLSYALGLYRNGILLAPAVAAAMRALILEGTPPDPAFAL